MRAVLSLALLSLAACATPRDVIEASRHAPLRDTAALEAWVAAHPNAPARADALYALCSAHARLSQFREAAETCGQAIEIEGDGAEASSRQALAFWRTLESTPSIAVRGQADVTPIYGWTGMAEIPVVIDGETTHWGIDTGAELSLLTQSMAQRLGARMFDQDVEIHGSTPGTAAGRLGVIDAMRVGDAVIEHVPVFVLPDAALTGPEGQVLPPVFGAPIIYAFGRIEFLDHGARVRLTSPEAAPLPGRIAWSEDGLAITLSLPRGDLQAHLDTGANHTEFNSRARALLSPSQRAALTTRTRTVAGVSGQVQREVAEADALNVGLGGVTCRFGPAQFGDDDGGGLQGRAGIDLVRACNRFVLDVSTMSFAAGD